MEAEENAEKDRMEDQDKKRKGGAQDEIQTTVPAHKNGGKSLVLLQVNCRIIYNKALEFWNLVDTYNPDIVIGKESWLREEIGNTEYLGRTSRLLEEKGLPGVEACLFVLKIILPARSYGLTTNSG